jgi:hypothetical protein
MMIGQNWGKRPGFGGRDAQWQELPATEAQKALLARYGIAVAADVTRGAASALIHAHMVQRPKREEP